MNQPKLWKTLAIAGFAGSAALAVTPSAQAVVTYNCPTAALGYCTLADLYAGSTIQADDKLFSMFNFENVNTGGVNANNIRVTGFMDNDTTPEYDPGLKFEDFGDILNGTGFGEWDTRRTGPGSIIDYHFSYKVEVTDPSQYITDNYLKEFESELILPTEPTSNARAEVHEFVFEDQDFLNPAIGNDPIDGGMKNEKDVLHEFDSDTGEFVEKRLDKLDFQTPYKQLFIFKEVTAESFGIGPNVSYGVVNSFEQSFSQTKAPEPGTIFGLLAVSGLGVAAKRKKQK
ncbi:hypothetical protein CY0110_00800 [Crocosphaera chwakensis CCY0110]|uniref:PEP-CTERM protein-sorting domain-containing protein n=2 Tax=Crocosphaera TaxID=263510 RepID=A3IWQ7_9CHRO|nr:PEP-CTERM sorting domain-containing protein [Crocosphaera chwakensis]EAZ89112.1 hypothetical protein CY0110_00800 [Crocosphaera chwakensis CCY0110]